jgi:tRNA-dihydrouridine synthase 2
MTDFWGRYNCVEIAAPMVRASTLPFREECQKYGANIVFTEEVIDKKILDCTKELLADGTVLFKTEKSDTRAVHFNPGHKDCTTFQLGTADEILAVKAATQVVEFVSEVNVNMGCPKSFSIQGGMGAALLSSPERATSIVRGLRDTLPPEIPVTCKIRFIGEDDSNMVRRTSEFASGLINAGADAITVHMRTVPMRPREPAIWASFTDLILSLPKVPIIANGDFFTRSDITKFKEQIGQELEGSGRSWSESLMIARGALYNPSIFASSGPLPIENVVEDFVACCEKYNEPPVAVKWIVAQMMDQSKMFHGEPIKLFRERIQAAKTMQDIRMGIAAPQTVEIKKCRLV